MHLWFTLCVCVFSTWIPTCAWNQLHDTNLRLTLQVVEKMTITQFLTSGGFSERVPDSHRGGSSNVMKISSWSSQFFHAITPHVRLPVTQHTIKHRHNKQSIPLLSNTVFYCEITTCCVWLQFTLALKLLKSCNVRAICFDFFMPHLRTRWRLCIVKRTSLLKCWLRDLT